MIGRPVINSVKVGLPALLAVNQLYLDRPGFAFGANRSQQVLAPTRWSPFPFPFPLPSPSHLSVSPLFTESSSTVPPLSCVGLEYKGRDVEVKNEI